MCDPYSTHQRIFSGLTRVLAVEIAAVVVVALIPMARQNFRLSMQSNRRASCLARSVMGMDY